MGSGYRPEEDESHYGQARRSKAGSLQWEGGMASGRKTGQSYAPQAIVKVAGWAKAPASAKRMLDYIARIEDKEKRELAALESEDGVQRIGKEDVAEVFDEWKEDFKREKKDSEKSRLAVHLVLSAKAELTQANFQKTQEAARRTVEKHFGEKGYKYAMAVHKDGKSPHVHVVVKSVSTDRDVPKLRLDPKDLLEIRKDFATELTREGLKHVASREPKRSKVRHPKMAGKKPTLRTKVEAVIKNLDKEQRQFERSMRRKEPIVNAIKFREQQAKALDTLRTQVKEDSTLTDKERKETFNLIRGFRREIEKKGNDPLREVEATVNHFESRMAQWQKQVEKENRVVPHGKEEKIGSTTKSGEMWNALSRDISRFSHDLRKQPLPVEEKQAIHKHLRQQYRAMMKIQERSMGLGR